MNKNINNKNKRKKTTGNKDNHMYKEESQE